MLAAFAGGVVATLWTAPTFNSWWRSGDPADGADNASVAATDSNGSVPAAGEITAQNVAALEARVAALSVRLDAVSDRALVAGVNATRAESLLIAFATRRALDRGVPLGYLEGELRLRFGDAQPRAVATIINAAHAPVTIAGLQAGLERIAPALIGAQDRTDWWTAAKRELRSLIIIRKASEPSPVPQQAVERARMLLITGRADAALTEIERLPNHEKADNWIQMARAYNEARRALDVIEAAAILERRSMAIPPRTGAGASVQAAPPPPTPKPTGN